MTDMLSFLRSSASKAEAGGAKKLAILLSFHGHQITPQAISQWKKTPAERAHLISELTGIPFMTFARTSGRVGMPRDRLCLRHRVRRCGGGRKIVKYNPALDGVRAVAIIFVILMKQST